MKLIPLTKGMFAKVDDHWYDLLMKHCPWYVNQKRPGGTYYAVTCLDGVIIPMHQFIKDAKEGETIDHINTDTLDNQEHNLRSATDSQQIVNRRTRRDSSSGIPGVSWDKTARTWRVYTNKDGRRICLGLRKNLQEALDLRNRGVVSVHGEFARLFEIDGSHTSAKETLIKKEN